MAVLSERPRDVIARRAKGNEHFKKMKKSPGAESTKTYEQLNPKQKQFIRFVAEGESKVNAALKAGVSPCTSRVVPYQWLKIPAVREAIEKERLAYAEESKITKRKVMEMHMEAFEMAKLMSEPSTMVSAAREMGKLCGYYEPKKVDVSLNVSGQIERMDKLTDAQLLEIINKGGADEILAIAYDETDES